MRVEYPIAESAAPSCGFSRLRPAKGERCQSDRYANTYTNQGANVTRGKGDHVRLVSSGCQGRAEDSNLELTAFILPVVVSLNERDNLSINYLQ
jgi:hypothetical protein